MQYLDKTKNNISSFIESQMPQFMRTQFDFTDDGTKTKILKFMEYYYQWLEKEYDLTIDEYGEYGISTFKNTRINQVVNEKFNLFNALNRIRDFTDIDEVPFKNLRNLRQQLMPDVPEQIEGDVRRTMKLIKDFNTRKGTDKAFSFMFRALFNKSVDVVHYEEKILVPSSAKWKKPIFMRAKLIPTTNVIESDLDNLIGYHVRGETSGAKARILSVNHYYISGIRVSEFLLDKIDITGYFVDDEYLEGIYIQPQAEISVSTIKVGGIYRIHTVGDTDFKKIGASENTVGYPFRATKVGEGTGLVISEDDIEFSAEVIESILIPDTTEKIRVQIVNGVKEVFFRVHGSGHTLDDNLVISNTGSPTGVTLMEGGTGYDAADSPFSTKNTAGGDGTGLTITVTVDGSGVVQTGIVTVSGTGYADNELVMVDDGVKLFNAQTAVDLTNNTINIPSHGFSANAPVRYLLGTGINSITKTFNAHDDVGVENNIITILNHGLSTTDRVVYTKGTGDAPTGLVTGTSYYVIKIDAHRIRLATSYAYSADGNYIDITGRLPGIALSDTTSTSSGAGYRTIASTGHGLAVGDQVKIPSGASDVFEIFTVASKTTDVFVVDSDLSNSVTAVQIYKITDFSTVDDHILLKADVYHDSDSAIGGLVGNTVYYIIVDDADNVSLSATSNGAVKPLTSYGGISTDHSLTGSNDGSGATFKITGVNSTATGLQARITELTKGEVDDMVISDGGTGYQLNDQIELIGMYLEITEKSDTNFSEGEYILGEQSHTTAKIRVVVGNKLYLDDIIGEFITDRTHGGKFGKYKGETIIRTNTAAGVSTAVFSGSFVDGTSYRITKGGVNEYVSYKTKFTLIGADNNKVGTIFTATGTASTNEYGSAYPRDIKARCRWVANKDSKMGSARVKSLASTVVLASNPGNIPVGTFVDQTVGTNIKAQGTVMSQTGGTSLTISRSRPSKLAYVGILPGTNGTDFNDHTAQLFTYALDGTATDVGIPSSVVNGEIEEIEVLEGGSGFVDPPYTWVETTAGIGANFIPFGSTIGGVEKAIVVSPGINYTEGSTVATQEKTEPWTTSKGSVSTSNIIEYDGEYLDNRGFLSGESFIQDGRLYDNWSYVVGSDVEYEKWVDPISTIAHPVGTRIHPSYTITKTQTTATTGYIKVDEGFLFDGSSASTFIISDSITLTTTQVAALTVNDAVIYSNGGGGDITGLIDSTTYYIHSKPTATTIKLKISVDEGFLFDGSDGDVVILSSDSITLTTTQVTTLTVNDAVVYSNGGGGNITGLTDGTIYYIHSKTATTIKLKITVAATDPISLTVLGTGTTHRVAEFIRLTAVGTGTTHSLQQIEE